MMTVPDCAWPAATNARVDGLKTLRVGLEWFLNPHHLALIAVRDWGLAAARGLTLVLDEPKHRYDGFAALARGQCDLILTEPLYLLEPMGRACEPLGCLFETKGGVLVREDRLGKLRAGETIRVASPVPAPLTDRLCRRILQGWAGNQGFAVAETQIVVEPAGFHHTDNLQAGFDAAWLVFANVEAISTRLRGLPVRLVTAEEGGLPGFSGLELAARKGRRPDETARHEALISVLEAATHRLRADPIAATALWREVSGADGEEATRIVEATLPCLKAPLNRDPQRWQALQALLQEA
jgi:ABC-type nitrate/sulfonate/bicarbonate transport system substrate-binding protein